MDDLKQKTDSLLEAAKENRAECPICHKQIRIYIAYHQAYLCEHRSGNYFEWCDGGNRQITFKIS